MSADWGPIFVSVVLFVLLSPGLLFQLPGSNRCVEFGNLRTSGASIMLHALLFFALICLCGFVENEVDDLCPFSTDLSSDEAELHFLPV
ncbi:hypothetical protein VitviT2T_001531 [Vitis vinifera]|uniref:Transmembrane protein n=1 Tax=Vitis vinifera TaxID=29760 RepID=A0ABY9BFV3_VITVI|nr:hypothetical protein VitviT2T_001531 [Vitis vinifera]